jgi:hypothetical protein
VAITKEQAVSRASLGGRSRKEKLSPQERSNIASNAAKERWRRSKADAQNKAQDLSRNDAEFARLRDAVYKDPGLLLDLVAEMRSEKNRQRLMDWCVAEREKIAVIEGLLAALGRNEGDTKL